MQPIEPIAKINNLSNTYQFFSSEFELGGSNFPCKQKNTKLDNTTLGDCDRDNLVWVGSTHIEARAVRMPVYLVVGPSPLPQCSERWLENRNIIIWSMGLVMGLAHAYERKFERKRKPLHPLEYSVWTGRRTPKEPWIPPPGHPESRSPLNQHAI